MSIKATVDGQNYTGISKVNAGGKLINLTETGTIPTPTEAKDITENGSYDVLNFARAVVNVAASGGAGFVEGEYSSSNFNTQKSVPVENPDNKSYIMIVVNKKYEGVKAAAIADAKTYGAAWVVLYNGVEEMGSTLNICFTASGDLTFYNGGTAVTATSAGIGGTGASLPANTAEWRNFKTYLMFIDVFKDT